jgi:hypothetical protein
LIGKGINIVKKYTKAVFDTSKGRLVYKEIQKELMFMLYHENSGRIHNIKMVNNSLKNVAEFKYLGLAVTKQNYVHEENYDIKIEGCLVLFSSELFVFPFPIKNVKIKVYSIMKHVALHGCEMLSFTLREEHRLRVFEIRVLRRIFGSKREEIKQKAGENYVIRSSI